MPCENSKKNLRISAKFCMMSFMVNFSFEAKISSTSSNPFSISQLEVRSTVSFPQTDTRDTEVISPKEDKSRH